MNRTKLYLLGGTSLLALVAAATDAGATPVMFNYTGTVTKMTAGMEAAPFATDPEAVADAIVNGLASGKDVVWVPPALRWVMTVFRHMPRPVWRRVSASR